MVSDVSAFVLKGLVMVDGDSNSFLARLLILSLNHKPDTVNLGFLGHDVLTCLTGTTELKQD